MKRKYKFYSGLLVGLGIIGSTIISELAAKSGWLVLTGPLLMAAAIACADLLNSQLQDISVRPSREGLAGGAAILLAATIVAIDDPAHVIITTPLVGSLAGVYLLEQNRRQIECKGT